MGRTVRTPGEQVTFTAGAAHAQVTLPADDQSHPQLPRTWAKARVDALLEKIEREGEDRASIDEIIRLSRKYKFVTPYTSFLAAPRSLLRPRVIRPGDPVIRVQDRSGDRSVMALFPFGLTKPLRYLKDEDIWQTRFLAPADLADGTYPRAPDPARSRGARVPGGEDFRDREQAAAGEAATGEAIGTAPARRCSCG